MGDNPFTSDNLPSPSGRRVGDEGTERHAVM
jgi:hypothetical protein